MAHSHFKVGWKLRKFWRIVAVSLVIRAEGTKHDWYGVTPEDEILNRLKQALYKFDENCWSIKEKYLHITAIWRKYLNALIYIMTIDDCLSYYFFVNVIHFDVTTSSTV